MNSSDFLKLHDIALADTLSPNLAYHYRAMCRWYAEKFHTALHIVENELPPSYVVRHYYEANMASMDDEDIDLMVFKALNPDFNEEDEEDLAEFISMVEKEDKTRQERLAKKKQSLEGKKPSDTPDAKVSKTYEGLPPPEANHDPDSILDTAPVLGTKKDDPSSL